MMRYPLLSALVLCLSLTSCDTNEILPPEEPHRLRILSITSPQISEFYLYDKNSMVTFWYYEESLSGWDVTYQAEYDYPAYDRINIQESESSTFSMSATQTRNCDETLFLDHDGVARYSEGLFTYLEDDFTMLQKKYRCEFKYNHLLQLEVIAVSEWRTDQSGWTEERPLTYNILIEWTGNDITRIVEPNRESTFTYFNGTGMEYRPIIGFNIFRASYTPLKYCGVFGAQPANLLRSKTISDTGIGGGSSYKIDYSYSLSHGDSGSKVEKYTEAINGMPRQEYSILWE